jgi:hypothetical protein
MRRLTLEEALNLGRSGKLKNKIRTLERKLDELGTLSTECLHPRYVRRRVKRAIRTS